jgi:hypothetical protein
LFLFCFLFLVVDCCELLSIKKDCAGSGAARISDPANKLQVNQMLWPLLLRPPMLLQRGGICAACRSAGCAICCTAAVLLLH